MKVPPLTLWMCYWCTELLCCDEVVDLRTAWSTSFPSALLAVVANLSWLMTKQLLMRFCVNE